MTWTLVQKSAAEAVTASGTTVTPTLPGGSTAGAANVLIATLTNSGSGTWSAPAGWAQVPGSRAINSGNCATEQWWFANNGGGISSVVFTSSGTAGLKAALAEFHTDVASPSITVNAVGVGVAGAVSSLAVTTNTSAAAGDLAVCSFHQRFASAAAITWTTPAGFSLIQDDTASATHHLFGAYNLSVSAGALTVTGKSNTASDSTFGWGGSVATFSATAPSAGTAGLVGAFVNAVNVFGAGTTNQQGYNDWSAVTGRPNTVVHVYLGSIPAAITSDLSAYAAAGIKVVMNAKPAFSPPSAADQAALNTFLQSCSNAGLSAVVSLWAEPIGNGIPTAALCQQMFQFYYATVHQFYPVAFCTSGYAVKHRNENSYYPGDAYCDVVATDYYCSAWVGDGSPSYPSTGSVLDIAAAVADNASPPKPFGVYEFNGSNDPANGQTQAQVTAYFGYIQQYFLARIAAGKTNADLVLFNSNNGQTNLNTGISSASDYRVPLFDAMFDALNGGSNSVANLVGQQTLTLTQTGTLAVGTAMTGSQALTLTSAGVLATTGAVPWPQGPLPLKVELLGIVTPGVWTDVSAYVYQRDPILPGRGKPDETASVTPSSLGLTLNNRLGRFSPRNPNGPYYGLIGRNTQIRVSALPGTTRFYRFWGEVAEWPPRWDVTGNDVWAPIVAAGILRRYQQGTPKPLHSAMWRYWTLAASAVVAYWPCEAGSSATQFGASIGQLPMTIAGAPALASFGSFPCSDPLPVLNGSTWTGVVAPYSGSDAQVTFLLAIPAAGDTDVTVAARVFTNGGTAQLYLQYNAANNGTLTMIGVDSTNTILFSAGDGPPMINLNGQLLAVSMALQKAGVNVNYSLQIMTPGGTVQSLSGSLLSPPAIGLVTQVVINPAFTQSGGTQQMSGSALGHVAVQSSYASLSALAGPLAAFAGETAGLRFQRLCGEESIPFVSKGNLATTVPMGPQQSLPLISLLTECQAADAGMIWEPRDSFGLGYRTRASIGNQSAAAALSYTAAQLAGNPGLQPTEDDQFLVNDVTVTRGSGAITGSSAEVVLDDGSALSAGAPPNGVGPGYDTAVTLNLAYDSQCDDAAGWAVRMGTVNEPRYPVIPVNLRSAHFTAAQLAAVAGADIGDLITVTGTPAWLPPDGISAVISGMTETLGAYGWDIAINAIPATPWNTAVIGTSRFDTDGSTLHASIGSGDATFLADSTSGKPLWTTAAADFPFDMGMGGERITVTDIAGPPANFLTGQLAGFEGGTGTWTGAGNCSVSASGAQAHSGAGSLAITSTASGNMTAAHCAAGNILTQGLACSPGDIIVVSGWLLAATAGRACQFSAQYYNSSGTFLSSLLCTAVNDVTTGWTKVAGQLTGAPSNAAFCRLGAFVASTGGAAEVHYADDCFIGNLTTGSALTQSFTCTRSANGIVKAQSAGTALSLFTPSIFALS